MESDFYVLFTIRVDKLFYQLSGRNLSHFRMFLNQNSIFLIFFVAGPTVWNSLPDHLRDPAVDSEQFRRDLKTFVGHSKRYRIRGVA